MPFETRRIKQIFAILISIFFVAGFFYSPIGVWTGPILGLWLVGTQKPRAGFVWLFSFSFIPALLDNKSPLWHSAAAQIPAVILWVLIASLIDILPFIFHRLISPRLKGFLSTLPYPLAVALLKPVTPLLALWSHREFLLNNFGLKVDLFHDFWRFTSDGNRMTSMLLVFVLSWLAVILVKIWNHNFEISKRTAQIESAIATVILIAGYFVANAHNLQLFPVYFVFGNIIEITLIFSAALLTLWAFIRPAYRTISWVDKAESIALLESPTTHTPLHFQREGQHEFLVSASGERFPILNEIPQFVAPESISGANKKYNHLYQAIGGFYDDTQRVIATLSGISVDDHFLAYLGNLELKSGDKVLETSVGTGLNWKYLPRGVELYGLDLSTEMLINCQTNLRRWNLNADLVLGNAEELPYADESFDCVFHVGGINFFSDRAKAIREMIRVAKPGTRILIADETEKHVKTAYENIPYTSGYFKGRDEAVLAPIDLVPPEMLEIKLDTSLQKGHFYVLTFRKPPAVRQTPKA